MSSSGVEDDTILDVLRSADEPRLTTTEIADELPITRGRTRTRLGQFIEEEKIERKSAGNDVVWWLPEREEELEEWEAEQAGEAGKKGDGTDTPPGAGADESETETAERDGEELTPAESREEESADAAPADGASAEAEPTEEKVAESEPAEGEAAEAEATETEVTETETTETETTETDRAAEENAKSVETPAVDEETETKTKPETETVAPSAEADADVEPAVREVEHAAAGVEGGPAEIEVEAVSDRVSTRSTTETEQPELEAEVRTGGREEADNSAADGERRLRALGLLAASVVVVVLLRRLIGRGDGG